MTFFKERGGGCEFLPANTGGIQEIRTRESEALKAQT